MIQTLFCLRPRINSIHDQQHKIWYTQEIKIVVGYSFYKLTLQTEMNKPLSATGWAIPTCNQLQRTFGSHRHVRGIITKKEYRSTNAQANNQYLSITRHFSSLESCTSGCEKHKEVDNTYNQGRYC